MVFSEMMRKPSAYLLVGACCTILVNIVLIAGDALGLPYLVSCAVCLFGVGAVGYVSHSRWTFRRPLSWTAYGRFVLGMSSSTSIVVLALFVGVTLLHYPVSLVSPIITALMIVWNFLCARWAIERKAIFRRI